MAVGVLSTAVSRVVAGTTEFVLESQSALTLLLSTFCCWARHHMNPDSPTRMRKISPSPARSEPVADFTPSDTQNDRAPTIPAAGSVTNQATAIRPAGTSNSGPGLPVGLAAVHLGAGRREKDDAIDHSVGVVCLKKRGDAVERGEPLAEIHARDEAAADEAESELLAAYAIGDEPVPERPVLLEALP